MKSGRRWRGVVLSLPRIGSGPLIDSSSKGDSVVAGDQAEGSQILKVPLCVLEARGGERKLAGRGGVRTLGCGCADNQAEADHPAAAVAANQDFDARHEIPPNQFNTSSKCGPRFAPLSHRILLYMATKKREAAAAAATNHQAAATTQQLQQNTKQLQQNTKQLQQTTQQQQQQQQQTTQQQTSRRAREAIVLQMLGQNWYEKGV